MKRNYWNLQHAMDRRHFLASNNSHYIIRVMTRGYSDSVSYVIYDTRKYSYSKKYRLHSFGNFHNYAVMSGELSCLKYAKNRVVELHKLEDRKNS